MEVRVGTAELTRFMAGAFPGGVPWTIRRLDTDGVALELPTDDRHLRPGGTVSGPTMMMLADSAAYAVILAAVGLEALAVTTNLSINFLRRATPGTLVAEATLLKAGRTQALAEVRLHDGDPDHLVAHATVTYSRALTIPTRADLNAAPAGGQNCRLPPPAPVGTIGARPSSRESPCPTPPRIARGATAWWRSSSAWRCWPR